MTATTTPIVRVSVQPAAGVVTLRAGRSRLALSPIAALGLAAQLELAAEDAERRSTR